MKKEIHKKEICVGSLEKSPGCIQSALSVIGDKWTGLVLSLLAKEPHIFSDLSAVLVGMSPRTLSQRLKKLQDTGVVHAVAYQEHPVRMRYELTNKGKALIKIIRAMADWGELYKE